MLPLAASFGQDDYGRREEEETPIGSSQSTAVLILVGRARRARRSRNNRPITKNTQRARPATNPARSASAP